MRGGATPEAVEPISACRSCGAANLLPVLDLGATPLANELRQDANAEQARYPLAIALCSACTLVQNSHRVPGAILFGRGYPYFSSVSTAYLEHARRHALELIASRGLGPQSLVVEAASNDGYLLRNFVERGIPVLGIDPAEGPAAAARASGVETRIAYFGLDLARELRNDGLRADVVIGNNVLAHVDDVNDFVAGVATLLRENGVAAFEAPYLVDLVERCAFDTIYHEHNCYFSLTSLRSLFERHGLHLLDVRRLTVHGGSLRVFAGFRGSASSAVGQHLVAEEALGLGEPAYYDAFRERVRDVLSKLRALLADLRAQGKHVAAYAAAAKGAVICSVANLDTTDVAYVVDRNPHKQGHFMPGSQIPIVGPDRLESDPPDYLLLFAWNLADEIRAQLTSFRGRFIVPIPEPRVL